MNAMEERLGAVTNLTAKKHFHGFDQRQYQMLMWENAGRFKYVVMLADTTKWRAGL